MTSSPDPLDPTAAPRKDANLPMEPSIATLADALEHVRPRLSAELTDAAAVRAVAQVAGAIPATLSSFWGLESRLGVPEARVDFLWELRRASPGADLLAGQGPDSPARRQIDTLCAQSPTWAALRRFAESWLQDSAEARAILNIWLEADTGGTDDPLHLTKLLHKPCVFWGADPETPSADRALLARLPDLAKQIFDLHVDPARLSVAVAQLPDRAEVFQMGVMGARAGSVTRLCLRKIDPLETANWLTSIGWPGDADAVQAIMRRLRPMVGQIALNVDILPQGTGPKLGLELYRPGEGIDPAQWRPLFDTLTQMGLARTDKLAGLSAFPHQQRYSQSAALRRDPPLGYPVIVQNLHHIKLVMTGSTPVEAKAYLGVYRPGFDYSDFVGGQESGARGGWIVSS
jgi:hypothetical protein